MRHFWILVDWMKPLSVVLALGAPLVGILIAMVLRKDKAPPNRLRIGIGFGVGLFLSPVLLLVVTCTPPPGRGRIAETWYQKSVPLIASLELYRKQRGNYPASLDKLVPQYLSSTQLPDTLRGPHGWMHYWRANDGYHLMFSYSAFGNIDCTYRVRFVARGDSANHAQFVARDALADDAKHAPGTDGWRCYGYM